MNEDRQAKIRALMDKGVDIHCPDSVDIGIEVDPDRISGEGVRIHRATRICGRSTLIMSHTELGREAPVSVENCLIGPNVKLGGGFFSKAVFLDGASMKSCGHVRQGTILEEGARAAHSVALKQTILFPFVTLGSLINFCDCLMAGGTSAQNHSEVGSSYIHFNYTPNQDKATASLIGDVPHGVMLNQPAIFLGGQGGMVGPRRMAFGSIVAAGTICRQDELRPARLILGGGGGLRQQSVPFTGSGFHNTRQIVAKNILYIGNLFALRQWYLNTRGLFVGQDFPESLLEGLVRNVRSAIEERIRRLGAFCRIMAACGSSQIQVDIHSADNRWLQELGANGNLIEDVLNGQWRVCGHPEFRERFLTQVEKAISRHGSYYVRVIQSLDQDVTAVGTLWLQSIVKQIDSKIGRLFPEINIGSVTDE